MDDDKRPFHNPFGALAHLRGERPAAPDPPAPTPPAPDVSPVARAVVRMERSGRGGKTVTVIEQLDLPPAKLEKWLKDLKSDLGCGGVIEAGAIVLQGDHRKRLPGLLGKRGVRKVKS
jgi:translation initiation factor 1